MLPTFSASTEWIVEDAISVKLINRPISRGDLIILSSPREPKQDICKRVLGLPGDTICVDPTGESSPDIPTTEHCIVPPGHIWIIGDNASNSRDSRLYGPVPIGLVKSRVVLRVSIPVFFLFPSFRFHFLLFFGSWIYDTVCADEIIPWLVLSLE